MVVSEVRESGYNDILPYEIMPQSEAERLPYFTKLVAIRSELERYVPKFPHWKCLYAARAVAAILSLPEADGVYTPPHKDNPPPYSHDTFHQMDYLNFQRMHYWNYDESRGLYIDLTQDQFVKTLPGVVILPHNTSVLQINIAQTNKLRSTPTTSRELCKEISLEELINLLRQKVA